ncbi:MAG TPA: aspartyl protease [Planctomycetes bacterium]|nr:aspartyl protease [Planctomycetota bacterium]
MGLTYIEGMVENDKGVRRRVSFLVDSGASYSLLPVKVWKALGLKPKRTLRFVLADGSAVSRKVSECRIALEGREGHTPVVLGEPGDDALLGVVTLENLGLVLDPFRRRLQAMQTRLG